MADLTHARSLAIEFDAVFVFSGEFIEVFGAIAVVLLAKYENSVPEMARRSAPGQLVFMP